MSLSSETLFHLTDNKENVFGILTEGFKYSYCKDSIVKGSSSISYYTPIVSFCDIPLSQIRNHVDRYGKYGIGLSKTWAQTNKLNPVLYMDKESKLLDSYLILYNEYILKKGKFKWEELDLPQKGIVEILRYTKMVQDDLIRKSAEPITNYKFSDEKEWRIAAEYSEEYSMLLDGILVDFGERKVEMNSKLNKLRLEFNPKDIEYLIFKRRIRTSNFY